MTLRDRLAQCQIIVPAGTLAPSFAEVERLAAEQRRNRRTTRRLARRGHEAAVLQLRYDIDQIPVNSKRARKGW